MRLAKDPSTSVPNVKGFAAVRSIEKKDLKVDKSKEIKAPPR